MLDAPTFDPPAIIVTASRSEEPADATPASATLIDAIRIARIGAPLVTDYLRLVPSVSVSMNGPAGTLAEVRIRGAEANHTLLFVEGIRANDPAAGNTPRFELLNADTVSRIEVVRGPQSALWGSEAIGGVVAVDGAAHGGAMALLEGGSFGTWRGAARGGIGTAERGLSLGIAGQRSNGIDSFSGDGERDGYRNITARASGAYRLSPSLSVGSSGFAVRGRSEYDGTDIYYLRADTLDSTRNRLGAARLYATLGAHEASYATASASLLGSSNRNYLGDAPVNRTSATRRTVALEVGHAIGRHRFIAAIDGERETFASRATPGSIYAGVTDQNRSRRHQSVTVEWKMTDMGPVSTDVALRHDFFSAFRDATNVRASALAALGGGFQLSATYGQGIAQPTFFDLYGYYPGDFVGNPALRPESSRGGEVSLRYRHKQFGAALTAFRQRLRDEIVGVYTYPNTTANAAGTSRRAGFEAEASWTRSAALRLSASYAFLDANELDIAGERVREQRRPKHSGSVAVDGRRGRLSYGAAVAYTGARIDSDYDLYPTPRVRLAPYWLASGQIAYRVAGPAEVTLRVANAFDSFYQDVVGYRTEGRSVHAGLRFRLGD